MNATKPKLIAKIKNTPWYDARNEYSTDLRGIPVGAGLVKYDGEKLYGNLRGGANLRGIDDRPDLLEQFYQAVGALHIMDGPTILYKPEQKKYGIASGKSGPAFETEYGQEQADEFHDSIQEIADSYEQY